MRIEPRSVRHRLILLVASLLACLSLAFTPPPLDGACTDTSGKLAPADDAAIEADLAARRVRTHRQIAVLVVGSLDGESIEDVAYRSFNAWKIGEKGLDDGVLLVIAPNDRKMRIETGKGIGHLLTDIESAHILDDRMRPLLREQRYRQAILAGVAGIDEALAGELKPARAPAVPWNLIFAAVVGGGIILFLIVLVARAGRKRGGGSWGHGSSSSSSDSSWTVASSSSSWDSSSSSSSFDSGGSSFSGDGGSSGGGGASSDW